MSDIQPASSQETRDAAVYFTTLHHIADVDEKGFLKLGEDTLTLGKEENEHPVVIYQDPMPDPKECGGYWVLNPFSLKAQPSHALKFLYKSYRTSIANYTLTLLTKIINAVLVNKGINIKHDAFISDLPLSSEIRELTAIKTDGKKSVAAEIDAKMFDEVLSLQSRSVMLEFFTAVFISTKLRTKANIPFLGNLDWFSEIDNLKIRKKSLEVFKALILTIFGVTDEENFIETYSAEADLGEPARFASLVRSLSKLHLALNKYYVDLDDSMVVDISILEEHIGNLVAYTKRAKNVASEKIMPPRIVEGKEESRTPRKFAERIEEEPRKESALRRLDREERARSMRRTPAIRRDDYDREVPRRPLSRGRFGGVSRRGISGQTVPSHLSAGGSTVRRVSPSPADRFGSRFDRVYSDTPYIRRS